jgi:hypothetical protein
MYNCPKRLEDSWIKKQKSKLEVIQCWVLKFFTQNCSIFFVVTDNLKAKNKNI